MVCPLNDGFLTGRVAGKIGTSGLGAEAHIRLRFLGLLVQVCGDAVKKEGLSPTSLPHVQAVPPLLHTLSEDKSRACFLGYPSWFVGGCYCCCCKV